MSRNKFTNIPANGRVRITIEADVRAQGTDKNGQFLQTRDNRFYVDQPTIKAVEVVQRSVKDLPDGSVIQFHEDDPRVTFTKLGNSVRCNTDTGGTISVSRASTYDYTTIYDPEEDA